MISEVTWCKCEVVSRPRDAEFKIPGPHHLAMTTLPAMHGWYSVQELRILKMHKTIAYHSKYSKSIDKEAQRPIFKVGRTL